MKSEGTKGIVPNKDFVLIEIKERKQKIKLHLPDGVDPQTSGEVDLTVMAVGEDVKLFEVGDVVYAPCPPREALYKTDLFGTGEKGFYVFLKEEEIFGKEINKENK